MAALCISNKVACVREREREHVIIGVYSGPQHWADALLLNREAISLTTY